MSLLFLGGCASTPPFQSYSGADAAKVRFVIGVEGAWMDIYPPDRCTGGLNIRTASAIAEAIARAVQPPNPRVGMLDTGVPSENAWEYSLAPGHVVNAAAALSYPGNPIACVAGANFTVEGGKQYEVRFLQSSGRCGLAVDTLEQRDGTIVRSPIQDRRELACK